MGKKVEGDRPPRGRPAGEGLVSHARGDAERARLAVVQEVLARHGIERPLGGGELRRRAAEAAVLDLPERYIGHAREQVAEWRGIEARLEWRRPTVAGLGGALGRMVLQRLGGGRVGGSGAVGGAVGERVQTAVGNPGFDDGPGPELQVARAHLAVLGGEVINRVLMDEASGGRYLAAEAERDKARDEALLEPLSRGVAPNLVVDINTVPPQVLSALPMVGPRLARAVVAARLERPFDDLADLNRRVKGVGPETLARLAPYLRFGVAPGQVAAGVGLLSLDRFEGDLAVLVDDQGVARNVPRLRLPGDARPGQVFTSGLQRDEAATRALAERTAEVQGRSGAGDSGGPVRLSGPRSRSAAAVEGATGVWLDVLAGQPPGLLGGLSARDLPLKSIDELPMRGVDYFGPAVRSVPPRPDKAALEAAAALDKARDWRLRPEGDMERGAVPEVGSSGWKVSGALRPLLSGLPPLVGAERTWKDRIAARQAELWEARRRWKGVGLGRSGVVDPKLAREGSAAAGTSADRVWQDVLMGRPPGVLGGLSAADVPMKPVAVVAPPAAGGSGLGEQEELKRENARLRAAVERHAGMLNDLWGHLSEMKDRVENMQPALKHGPIPQSYSNQTIGMAP